MMDDTNSAEMPRYKCHKEVWALQIRELRRAAPPDQDSDGSLLMTPMESEYGQVRLDSEYVRKHKPEVGGYYIVYQDGYKSFSPALAFQEGYSRI